MNTPRAWFITGTDTGVGKTFVAAAMVSALVERGLRVAAMKPVAAGATLEKQGTHDVWHNEDADILTTTANVALAPELATPYLLQEAAAPHIAAKLMQIDIHIAHVLTCYAQVAACADAVVVEGTGGFCVPLSATEDTASLACQLGLPVIMVVGLRLGCLNHALLSVEAITTRGLTLSGWVANTIDPNMTHKSDNIEALQARLPAPLLGCIPHLAKPNTATVASCLDYTLLAGWPH